MVVSLGWGVGDSRYSNKESKGVSDNVLGDSVEIIHGGRGIVEG